MIAAVLAVPFLPDPTGPGRRDDGAARAVRPSGGEAAVLQHLHVKNDLADEVLRGRRPLVPVALLFQEMDDNRPTPTPEPVGPGRRELFLGYLRGSLDHLGVDATDAAVAALEEELRWELANPAGYGPRPGLELQELEERLHAVRLGIDRERCA